MTLGRPFLALAFALVLALAPTAARAQQDIFFQHLTVKDGLSQGSVMCMLQDNRGFMWIGTQDGLNRYDGYEFRVYKHDPANPASLNDNFILFTAEDALGALWFGTLGNPDVLDRFDPATETFTHVPRAQVNLAGAKIGQSKMTCTDPAGVVWSPNPGGGLSRVDPKGGAKKVYTHDPNVPGSLADNKVYSIVTDLTGKLWVATKGGLDRYEPRTDSFRHYAHDDKNPRSLSDNFVWPLLVDRTGTLWVGSFIGGLNRYDRATDDFTRYQHDEANPRSISSDVLYSLWQDASGMIWVGTGDHGADRFHPELKGFTHYMKGSGKNSLSDNVVLSLSVDKGGAVWLGTNTGLNRLDRKTGQFTLYRHDPANSRSIAEDAVQTILEDRSGGLWFGTLTSGLDRLDRANGTFTHYTNDPADPSSIPDNRIYALCEDRAGNLWVGTNGGGVARMDHATGRFTAYKNNENDPASLAANEVWALLEDKSGSLWIGTLGAGLDRLDPATGKITHFVHNDTIPSSLGDNIVITLAEDRAGNLWVGTNNGLSRFVPEKGEFVTYREKDGLPNVVIVGLVEDDAGNLWLSTNKGVSRFSPKDGKFRNYTYNDGLQANEFNQAACAKDAATGEILFGGPNGFNVFRPDQVRDNPYIPPVVFSSFVRYNSDDEEGKPIEDPGIETKPEITLSYKDNVANFRFAALNFYNTAANRYAYKLEGYSENWIQLGTDRVATFTNLDAGTYVLRVRGSNNNGLWNNDGAALRIVVTPPWWRTTWAYGTYGVLFVALLYTARRIEINRRDQKAKIRESQLHAKAIEAEKRALEAENERKQKELDDARNLQLSMLPREIPKLAGYEIAVFMKTATEVGGDYYDFTTAPDGTLSVAFGDATGHGMQAGAIVTLMKGLFISDGSRVDLQSFFNHCSRSIKDIKLGRLYMALTLARIQGKSVSLSSAGMPPAYLFRDADSSVEEILLKAMPLGAMKNFPYSLYETTMEAGDTLLFLTDGLPEQKNHAAEMFDYARVIESFKETARSAPADVITRLVAEGDEWMRDAVQEDDITLMVIKKIS
jgi:ligand-binding sensor domain-containing protein/serine phosphatase RsbU (regulator of sigma subunit)